MALPPIPEALRPLSWLIGKWKSISAKGKYPTIKPFNYHEDLTFENVGQPLLSYTSKTYHPETKKPMHLESGFLRIKPGTNHVAFLVAHNFGLTTVEEGCVENTSMKLKTKDIGRMSFSNDRVVTEITREYTYCCDTQKLELLLCMATTNTPLTEHLTVTYEKVTS